MKRVISLLATLVLMLLCVCPAYAASKPVISTQPETQTVEEGGKCSFSIKVKNAKTLTWYFVNPANGEEIPASKITKYDAAFKKLKLSGTNGKTLTLKKVPAELGGWSVYCHCYGNGYSVDSDRVLLIVGSAATTTVAPTEAPAEEAPSELPVEEASAAAPAVEPSVEEVPAEVPAEAAPAQAAPVLSVVNAAATPIDAEGYAIGDADTSFTLNAGDRFYITAEYETATWKINGIQLVLDEPVIGFTLTDLSAATTIEAVIASASSAAKESPVAEEAPIAEAAEEAPAEIAETPATEAAVFQPLTSSTLEAAPEGYCSVICSNCRFTGGGYTFAVEGNVPVGTTITVIAGSNGQLDKGYQVNSEEFINANRATFKMEVNESTSIIMQAQ